MRKLADRGLLEKRRLPGFARRVAITAESIDAYVGQVEAAAHRLQLVQAASA